VSAIAASFVRAQTMADGTLRLIVDVEPRDAVAAFGLFGQPGTAMALAALKPVATPEPEPEKPKGGYISKWLALRCQEADFWRFLGEHLTVHVRSSADAATFVRDVCGVSSRAEIDHDKMAKVRFDTLIRAPYQKWCVTRGSPFTAPEDVA
jgi:hypothetical protein